MSHLINTVDSLLFEAAKFIFVSFGVRLVLPTLAGTEGAALLNKWFIKTERDLILQSHILDRHKVHVKKCPKGNCPTL